MISENSSASSYDIRFGVSGLKNPSLIASFYPSDIPEDWLLDYYRNEFSLILMDASELINHSDIKKPSDAILTDAISELYEDIIGEDFIVLLDVSDIPEEAVKTLLPETIDEEKTLFLINFKNRVLKESPAFTLPLKWQKISQERGDCLLYYVTAQQAIEAVKLKEMIEQIREHAEAEEARMINVIFSATENALENCRNAIMLESMM